MSKIKVVVWDNIGNVLLGVRPWEEWSPRILDRLCREQPEAAAHAPSFAEIFRDYEIELAWLYDPVKAQLGFRELFALNSAILRDATDPVVVATTIREAEILILHKEAVSPEILRTATNLRLIQHLGQDIRGVPLDVAREMGVPVAAIPLTNYIVVAEQAWAMILGHLKRLPQQRAQMAARDYPDSWGYAPGLRYVGDLTLGLLGLGEIARPLARYARAFGMRIRYWDRVRFPELEAEYGIEWVEWDDLFREADVLSVQLALNPQTEGIVGAREIGLLKANALFVNTARGKLVDQATLTAAIRERRIGGAALEVFAEEPLPTNDPLLDLHDDPSYNLTLTPHSSSIAPWTWFRDSQAVWYNVLRVLRGEPIEWRV